MSSAARACLERSAEFQRWHFQDGPIDLIIGLHGIAKVCERRIEYAWSRFQAVLPELVSELPLLYKPLEIGQCGQVSHRARGPVACKMQQACLPYVLEDGAFLTPMAAVAGSVAEEILRYLKHLAHGNSAEATSELSPELAKCWVNNGGDIAWYGARDQEFVISIAEANEGARIHLPSHRGAWGVATSGWRGRSQSFGIADSVTVVAASAAQADVAATLVANRVSLGSYEGLPGKEHPAVVRRPALEVKDRSDLGQRLVTVEVGELRSADVQQALESGRAYAQVLIQRGWLHAAVLNLQGRQVFCGPVDLVQGMAASSSLAHKNQV